MMKKTFKVKLKSAKESILRWFDSSVGVGDLPEKEVKRVDWIRSIPFLGMHLVCLGVIWVGWSWTAVGVAAGLYAVRMFSITAFYHRYFSHRTFKTSRFMQSVFAVMGLSCVQRGPLWWAAHHRDHHRHSDREEDVHSPHQHGLLWSHMFWVTSKANFPTKEERVRDLVRYPELRFLNRFDMLVPGLLAAGLFGLGAGLERWAPGLGTNGPQLLIWGFFISTVGLFHATCTINSLAHLIGKKRYPTTDESRNSLMLALLTFGEGWHNNHHHFPASVRQGFYWWEIDISYYVLRVMAWMGLIWDLKKVPEKVREDRPSTRIAA